MKTFIKYLAVITAGVMLLTVGIVVGENIEKNNGALSGKNSTTVAIVNLDEGIEYQGEHRNFSTELIKNYSSNYMVTGFNDAQSGLVDGRYSAYIIIPSTFSSNVVSINSAPVKTVLEYKINGELSTEADDKAWMNVMEFKELLNDDLGYIFISSILAEFHKGQDSALKILENDSIDKEILMAISNMDLVATLDLSEIERLESDIQELTLSEDFEVNQDIINMIDLTYKGFLGEAQEDLTQLQSESTSLIGVFSSLLELISAPTYLFDEAGESLYALNKTLGGLDNYIQPNNIDKNAIQILQDEMELLQEDNAYFVSEKQKILDELADLETNIYAYEVPDSEVPDPEVPDPEVPDPEVPDLEVPNPDDTQINIIDLIEQVNVIKGQVEELTASDANQLQTAYNTMLAEFQTLSTELTEYIAEDMEVYNDVLVDNNAKVVTEVEEFYSNYGMLHELLVIYNPLLAVDEKEVEVLTNDLNTNNSIIEDKVLDKNKEYQEFANNSYIYANEYTQLLTQDLLEYQQKSDEQLSTGLSQAQESKEETTAENSQLMKSFINTLGYTKNGSIGNSLVYDFITAPSVMDGDKMTASSVVNHTNYRVYLYLICILLGGGTIVAIAVQKYRKNRDEE